MTYLSSASRARHLVALLLVAVACVQQLGSFVHGGMLARAALGVAMWGDVCTSTDAATGQSAPDPSKSPARADGSCGLCAAATMAQLAGKPALLAAAAPAVHESPSFTLASAPPARPWRHQLSRAPPLLLLS